MGRLPIAALAVAAALSAAPAAAAEICGVAEMVAAYDAGLKALAAKDHKSARGRFEPLAAMGFTPAQRRLGELARDGLGGYARDVREAGRWFVLAERAGDLAGREAAHEIKKALGEVEFIRIAEAAAEWRPELPSCLAPADEKPARLDSLTQRLGRSTLRVVGREFTAQAASRLVDPADPIRSCPTPSCVEDQVAARLLKRMAEVIRQAREQSPLAALSLAGVAAYEIVPSGRYDRHVGWKAGEPGRVLRVSAAHLLDRSPAFAARAVAWEAARAVYAELPDSRLADPYLHAYKGKLLRLSVYPDVGGGPFLDGVKQALDRADGLPREVRRYVEAIDEIHYNPMSKEMPQWGPPESAIGYYNRELSAEGRRIVFVRRDMKWSSVADLLITLVHEGTHIVQDATAERYERELADRQAALAALERKGEAGAAARTLREQIAERREYVDAWYRRGPPDKASERFLRFECEATMQEINAAKALGFDPALVKDTTGYVRVCDDVQVLIARWKDERLRQGVRQLK